MNKKQKIHNPKDWAQFALGYLSLAELAFDEIIKREHPSDEENSGEYDIKSIYIPALFNLKHGIEILLKALSIEFLNKEVLDQSDYSHDIEEIFSKLRKGVKEEKLIDAIKNYEIKHPSIEKRDFHVSTDSPFGALEELVEKYQSLEFLKEKIGISYSIKDYTNTALKYPTSDLNIQLDYEKIAEKVTGVDVRNSLIDCLKLEIIFRQLSEILLEMKMK